MINLHLLKQAYIPCFIHTQKLFWFDCLKRALSDYFENDTFSESNSIVLLQPSFHLLSPHLSIITPCFKYKLRKADPLLKTTQTYFFFTRLLSHLTVFKTWVLTILVILLPT